MPSIPLHQLSENSALKKTPIHKTANGNAKRSRRAPLPMRLRALPKSFWEEPRQKTTSDLSPSPLPPDKQEENTLSTCNTTAADTHLLFSLFSTLPASLEPGIRPKPRRGRPRKPKEQFLEIRDEDPYVTSAVAPEVNMQKQAKTEAKSMDSTLVSRNLENGISNSYTQRLQELAINL